MENEVMVSKREAFLQKLRGMGEMVKREVEEGCVIIVDRSGSMSEPAGHISKMDAVKRAVPYLNAVGINITYALVGFNQFAEVVTPETSSFANIIAGLDVLYPAGETSFANAISTGLQTLRGIYAGKKRIILLSDGRDNVGDVWQEVHRAVSEGIIIDTLAFGANADVYKLRRIAEMTGGMFYFVDTPLALEAAYRKLNFQVRYLTHNGG